VIWHVNITNTLYTKIELLTYIFIYHIYYLIKMRRYYPYNIYRAIKDNNIGLVTDILGDDNLDLNHPQLVEPPICYAINNDVDNNIIKLLINHPYIDLNIKNKYNLTALHCACVKHNFDIIKLLLSDERVNPYIFTDKNNSALQLACKYDQTCEIVIYLLENYNYDINLINNNGTSGFYLACYQSNLTVVKYLLENTDIDINITSNEGETAFNIVCSRNNNFDIFMLLYDIPKTSLVIDKPDDEGITPFMNACAIGCIKKIKVLLENNNIDFNKQSITTGRTAFYQLCSHDTNIFDRIDAIKLLLDNHNIDVNKEDFIGNTPFNNACCKGNKMIVEVLINNSRIDKFKPNKLGKTPLESSYGIRNELIKVVSQFVDKLGV